MTTKKIKAFSPATVANVSCGFDILGFAIDSLGDALEVERNDSGEIKILDIIGPGNLPTDPDKNVCGVIAKAMLEKANSNIGLTMTLTKGIAPGSGLGSSAASSAVAAFAINEILSKPFSKEEVVEFSMIGEKLASGSAHADNVAPAIYGGLVLVRSYDPLDIISIPVPDELYCTVIHPKIELRTEVSRSVLKPQIELKKAVKQWGNVAGLVTGMFKKDYELIGRSLEDHVIEPTRSVLIPGYADLTKISKESGALGCGISGSGPSIFSLCRGMETAQKVAEALNEKASELNLPFDIHVSKVSQKGSYLID